MPPGGHQGGRGDGRVHLREPRAEFFWHIDAANVDLKGFTGDFYRRICLATLDPVLETLLYLRHETDVWLEITSLLIPASTTLTPSSTP